ncbi:MAG TPA: CoB--CoM heterodisulfide reductase iron-sulfur subunit A family protein [bacterium]|nr:CoB--CoM heterodisulfide reductase iron-sulfur subunit A family protein [bacterium]
MDASTQDRSAKEVLVIGGGVAGMTAAIEAAEAGCRVVLIEKSPYLGGRVAGLNLYFPKLCPPACGLEINFQRIKKNPRIRVLTLAELERLEGVPGEFRATVKVAPRYVTDACTLCDACAAACPSERPDEFNAGLAKTKAAYLPLRWAFPAQYVIDRAACASGCHACAEACAYGAVDLDQGERRMTFDVAGVVVATGWEPYDATRIDNLGFGRYRNVVTNIMLERLAAQGGPTGGRVVRPSDGEAPKSVVFVQCAGSRDHNHLPYCSAVCCAASLKQATYLRAQDPAAEITIFYIDIRVPGHLEEFYTRVTAAGGLRLIKGKVGRVDEDPTTHDLIVTAEDVLNGGKMTQRANLVVLATGIVPRTGGLPLELVTDEFGFAVDGSEGLYPAGCAKRPSEAAASIRDGTGAALQALQSVVRGTRHG